MTETVISVNTIVVIEALIIAALLAWSGLWARVFNIYRDSQGPVWHVSLFLAANLFAVSASLASIILIFISIENGQVSLFNYFEFGIGLAAWAILIAFCVAVLFAIPVLFNALLGNQEWAALLVPSNAVAAFTVTLISTLSAAVLLIFSLLYFGPFLVDRLGFS